MTLTRSSARQELSPREMSKFEKRKAYSPSKDIRSSERARDDRKAVDSYARFGSPRSRKSSGRSRGRSPNYEDFRKEKSSFREDYRREKTPPREDYRREKSPRRERREYSPRYRRDSPEEIEKYRPRKHYNKYETENTDSMTESPEEYDRKSSKQSNKRESNAETVILEPREEKKSSTAIEKSEVDYENYSPTNTVPEKSQWGRNSPLSRIAAIEAEDVPIPEPIVSPVQEIIVEPAPEPVEKLYSSQLKMVEDSNNFLVAMPEDDGDSGIGFTVSDYHEEADFRQLTIPKQETSVAPEPKLWTLLSFSPTGPFKVRDDETGEIFTVINEFPLDEPEESNEVAVNENDKILDDEDDVGWCSLYLISRVIGLGLVCAGIAGMVLIALNK